MSTRLAYSTVVVKLAVARRQGRTLLRYILRIKSHLHTIYSMVSIYSIPGEVSPILAHPASTIAVQLPPASETTSILKTGPFGLAQGRQVVRGCDLKLMWPLTRDSSPSFGGFGMTRWDSRYASFNAPLFVIPSERGARREISREQVATDSDKAGRMPARRPSSNGVTTTSDTGWRIGVS